MTDLFDANGSPLFHASHYAVTVHPRGGAKVWHVKCHGGFSRGSPYLSNSCDFGSGAAFDSLEDAREAAIGHMLYTHTTGGYLAERRGTTTQQRKPYAYPGCRACYWINWLHRHAANTPSPPE